MDPGADVEAHRHKTGHHWIDLVLGGSAVVMSLVSILIGLEHGRTMQKLVEANSWPNLSFSTSNADPSGKPGVILSINNTGVGPARIESFELFYDGRPMASPTALFQACCATVIAAHRTRSFTTTLSPVADEVVPAKDRIAFLGVPLEGNDPSVWKEIESKRWKVRVRVCYCSVIGECWARDSAARRPAAVKQCAPSQPVEYRDAGAVAGP